MLLEKCQSLQDEVSSLTAQQQATEAAATTAATAIATQVSGLPGLKHCKLI